MLDLQAWADRISTPELKAELAITVDAAKQFRILPSIVLVPGRDLVTSKPFSVGGDTEHRVVAEVMVVTAVSRGNQALGSQARDELNAIRQKTLKKLIDWLPEGADIEVRWQEGRLLSLASNALVWADKFKTEYWWTP